MMAPVAGGMVSPMPTPSRPRPITTIHIGEAVPAAASTSNQINCPAGGRRANDHPSQAAPQA